MSRKTFEVISGFLQEEMNFGAMQAAATAKNKIDAFYIRAAQLINCDKNNIAFADSASRAWNIAVYGCKINPGDVILTLSSEFGTNLITLYDLANKTGAELKIIDCDPNGYFSVDEFENILKQGVKLVALSHAAAHGSIVNPVELIGKLTHKYGAIYIVDGCHAVGQIEVNILKINCDVYLTTGRKWLRGPRGTGFMYVNPNTAISPTQLDLAVADLILDGNNNIRSIKIRQDAKKFELWERSIANLLGLSNSINECLDYGVDKISKLVTLYGNLIRKAVHDNDNLVLIGSLESPSGVVGFYLLDPSKEHTVADLFAKENVTISSMSDWDCPLHFPQNGASKIFRVSAHYYTPLYSVEKVINIIKQLGLN